MELADTHCHLNHPAFDADGAAVLSRAQAVGVSRLLCIGYDLASSRRAAALAAAEPPLYAAVGVHPEAAGEWGTEAADALRALSQASGKVAAYGEIGLDYHWETIPRDRQRAVFREQIAFAGTLSPTLPLIIHCRDAQEDVLAVLQDSGTAAPVVMHCFTGDPQAARAILDAGHFLGIGGVATFKKSDALRAAVAAMPLDRILLETDCPYLAPQPWRGKRNEPSYLPAVARAVAAAKNLPVETVAAVTTATARTLFGMT
ncbi:MAG: TatD family hydrolase [Armatimonadetes bacterium]|nr:TatD family hydrolase [Armatimonadota bacterium]